MRGLLAPVIIHVHKEINGVDVDLEVVVFLDGVPRSPECRIVTLRQLPGGPPVTSLKLRDVPLAKLIREAAQRVTPPVEERARTQTNQGRRRRVSDEELQEAAAIYRAAVMAGRPPTLSIAAELGLTRTTAERWVTKARNRHFLGESRGAGRVTP